MYTLELLKFSCSSVLFLQHPYQLFCQQFSLLVFTFQTGELNYLKQQFTLYWNCIPNLNDYNFT